VSLEHMRAGFDPMGWATHPRSQCALDMLLCGAREGNSLLREIHARHLADGACNDSGKLLQRWDINGQRWVQTCEI